MSSSYAGAANGLSGVHFIEKGVLAVKKKILAYVKNGQSVDC